jgi:hypothetical protein
MEVGGSRDGSEAGDGDGGQMSNAEDAADGDLTMSEAGDGDGGAKSNAEDAVDDSDGSSSECDSNSGSSSDSSSSESEEEPDDQVAGQIEEQEPEKQAGGGSGSTADQQVHSGPKSTGSAERGASGFCLAPRRRGAKILEHFEAHSSSKTEYTDHTTFFVDFLDGTSETKFDIFRADQIYEAGGGHNVVCTHFVPHDTKPGIYLQGDELGHTAHEDDCPLNLGSSTTWQEVLQLTQSNVGSLPQIELASPMQAEIEAAWAKYKEGLQQRDQRQVATQYVH